MLVFRVGRDDREDMHSLRALTAALHRSWRRQVELDERRALLDRPWEEQFLHWSRTADGWELHGTLAPPAGRRVATTRSGWCPYACYR